MKKKNLLLAGVLLLSACTGHTTSVQKPDEKMMTIGNVTYTKDAISAAYAMGCRLFVEA